MKKFFAECFDNPKTTLGGLAILVGIVLWATSKIDATQFTAVAGMASTWIAFTAKDSNNAH